MTRRSTIRTALGVALSFMVPVAVVFTAPPAHAAAPISALTVDSAGDYIGAGQTLTFTSSNATFLVNTTGVGLAMNVNLGLADSFYAAVAAPPGQTLTGGTTYSTMRSPYASDAGLDVSGDGRGCNSDTGTLHVLDVAVDGSGNISSFAASYIQYCEGVGPALYGEIRYNSSVDFKADSVNPTSINFGNEAISSSTGPQTVTITNTGDLPLSLGAATLGGSSGGDYSLSSDTCSNTSVAVGASCTFDVVFTPSGGGTRAATLTLTADTARGQVAVSLTGTGIGLQTSVTLKRSASRVKYRGFVTLTAHLMDYTITQGKHLDVYATPYDGTMTLAGSGNVNASGDLTVRVRVFKRTDFVAQFPGDASYSQATSAPVTVLVYASVTGKLVHYYGASGHYRLYHYSAACPGSHQRCPRYSIKVSPNHGGQDVYVMVDAYQQGAWRPMVQRYATLIATSRQIAIIIYNNSRVLNVNLRVRVRFQGDVDHLARTSSWSFFRVTA